MTGKRTEKYRNWFRDQTPSVGPLIHPVPQDRIVNKTPNQSSIRENHQPVEPLLKTRSYGPLLIFFSLCLYESLSSRNLSFKTVNIPRNSFNMNKGGPRVSFLIPFSRTLFLHIFPVERQTSKV